MEPLIAVVASDHVHSLGLLAEAEELDWCGRVDDELLLAHAVRLAAHDDKSVGEGSSRFGGGDH